MRILLLASHLNAGGIAQYLLTLSRGLIASGHQVWIAAEDGDTAPALRAAGVHVVILPIRVKSELHPRLYNALPTLGRLIKNERIDIIHAQTRVTQVMAALLNRFCRVPFVTTCHGFFKPRFFRRILPCWGSQVIAISKPVVEHLLVDFQVSNERIVLIPNGIEIKAFGTMNTQEIKNHRREKNMEGNFWFGIIARLSEVKGIDILIEAFALLKSKPGTQQARLLIAGQGPDEKFLKDLILKYKLEDIVRFEHLTQQTAGLLPLMDVFVMPSRQEGLGLAVIEAMASAVPVIASKVGGLVDLIQDRETGILVKPQDPSALAEAMSWAMTHPKEMSAMAQHGQVFVRANFDARQMVTETIKVYEQYSRR